ncbi:hypothetical protein SEA_TIPSYTHETREX_72 [Mycobacterium phage TipsytheTRex]|nr:hypothetical protein SEA_TIPSYTHETREX_72 [Mycobacterium phage TipsytheTRex]
MTATDTHLPSKAGTKEYRKTLDLNPETSYTYVEMGPIPDMPSWHIQAQPSRFPFPTPEAALRFAQAAAVRDPGRDVVIAYPDGRRWNGQEFVA